MDHRDNRQSRGKKEIATFRNEDNKKTVLNRLRPSVEIMNPCKP